MDRISQLNALIQQFDLNQHPFYQEWSKGTLTVDMLRDYAGEYAKFVGTIADGWETLGNSHYAEEERVHEGLWADFRAEIGAMPAPDLPSTDVLVTSAKKYFNHNAATALGALYAFEAQQPATARAKYDGLDLNYQTSEKGKEYFKVHADDLAEIELLRSMLDGMSEGDFQQAKHACAVVCASMLGALDGIYYKA